MTVLGGDGHLSSYRRTPRVLLSAAEVEAAVEDLLTEDAFVIDIETTKRPARLNDLLWVGLGAFGRIYLIPCGHPHGSVLVPEHKEKTPACLLYPPPDPRGLTKTGKPSMAMKEHTVATVYDTPPKQLFAHEVCQLIKPLLWSKVGKVGHNVKFDLMSLAKYYGDVIPPGPYHDTIVLHHCLKEDLDDYSLKTLTCEWFSIHWQKRQTFYPNLGAKGITNFGLDEVARYLAKDLRYCWMMYQTFSGELRRKGVQEVYDFEMALYPVIMAMEYEGFPVDTSQQEKVREEILKRQADIQQEVWKLAGDQFSLNHTASKRWVMFGEGKALFGESKRPLKSQHLKVRDRTKETQQASVTQAVLEHYADSGNRVAELFLDWSLQEKLRGTFIDGLTGHLRYSGNGLPTIHTSFKQHGTVTGRLSASDPNLQQLPRGTVIRKLFVAGEGFDLIVADYDQIELRCAGYSSQDPEMIRVFKEGQDIHALAASAMLQIPIERVTKDQRQVGKTQNFGTLYGAGTDKIAAVAGVSKKRAADFIRNYFDTFAGLEDWKRQELKAARDRGDRMNPRNPPYVLIPPNGRRRRLPDLYSVDEWRVWRAERQAINAHVQGFASNITKLAMIDLFAALKGYPAWMIAQVHDEIVIRVASDVSDEVLRVVEVTMSGVKNSEGEPILGEIPLVVSAASGRSWADAKQ